MMDDGDDNYCLIPAVQRQCDIVFEELNKMGYMYVYPVAVE